MNLIISKHRAVAIRLGNLVEKVFGAKCYVTSTQMGSYLLATEAMSDYIQGYIQGIYYQYDNPVLTKDLEEEKQ